MFDKPQTRLFSRVTNPEEFKQSFSPKELRAEARKIIDTVDPKIAGFLSNFTLNANPPQTITVSDAVKEKLNGAPVDLFNAVARYIVFNGLSDDMKEKNLQTLAGFVNQRFTAIAIVAESKRQEDETDPFHPERHVQVLESKASILRQYGGSVNVGQSAYSDLMSAGCYFQKSYMTNDGQPAGQRIASRLQAIGITP